MVSEIPENTQLFLTDPSNSSGDRQITLLANRLISGLSGKPD